MRQVKIITGLLIVLNAILLQQAKAALLPAGTYSVGPSGTFPSVTSAITTINSATYLGIAGPIVLELNAGYAQTTETLTAVTNSSTTNTITIKLAASTSKIISSSSTATFTFNGARNFIIDGLVGGVKSLSIINTNVGGNAIQFINGSVADTVRNCIIKGQNTSTTSGIIVFGASTAATGNTSNAIMDCEISSTTSVNLSTNGIYLSGSSAAKANIGNFIKNNYVYDIFSSSQKSVGILLGDHAYGMTINNNHFYQTATRTTSAQWSAIEVNNKTNGNNITLNGNYIGGSAANASGTAMTFTFTGSGYFAGISIYGFSGTANVITKNYIKNLSITCNARNNHYGIYHSDGAINITQNNIGDLSTTGSILFYSNAPTVSFVSPTFTGICAGGGATPGSIGGAVNIQTNNVGSVNSIATPVGASTGANEFRGIFYQGSGSLVDISNNTIGGNIANSNSNTGNGATVGIVINSGYTTAPHTVKNNLVRNLSSSNPTTTPLGSLEGITTQAGIATNAAYIIDNNIVNDLTADNAFTMVGIKTSATIATQIITKNKIQRLQNKSGLAGSNVVGIELADYKAVATTPVATASTLSNNIISNLEMTAPSVNSGSVIWGLSIWGGRFNIFNNMIALGFGITDADITKNNEIIGIAHNPNYVWTTGAPLAKASYCTFYHNTVHVGGNNVIANGLDTKCFSGNTFGTAALKNNIFYNSRSNVSGWATNYSLFYTNNPTSFVSDFNVLTANGTGGTIAAFYNGSTSNYLNTTSLFLGRAIDQNSFSAPVKFLDKTKDLRPAPSPDLSNFEIANEALPITGYTTDIDGNTRNNYFPDMGCSEFKGTGCWIGQNSNAWTNLTVSGNWDDGLIPSATTDVKIFPNVDPALTQPVVQAAENAVVKNLIFRTTTRTTTNSSSIVVAGKLEINGDIKFKNNLEYTSAIDAIVGTIDMKGTATQILKPRWFKNTTISTLTNSNTFELTIAAPTTSDTMLISTALNYGASTTGSLIRTNDNLTLLSRFTGTANFGNSTGNSIIGKVNVERYMAARSAWRLLATPIQVGTSPTISQAWRENNAAHTSTGYGTRITGPAGPFGAASILDDYSINPSMKSYNAATNNFTGVVNANTTPIANLKGYYVFVRGDRSAAAIIGLSGITNLRIKGDLRTGTQIFLVPANKFESVGNPFASRIDMRTVNKANIVNGFSIWNPNSAGSYNVGAYETYTWDGTNYVKPGGVIRNYIESGEAFYVQSNSTITVGSLTINETDKATGSANVSRPGVTTPTLEINLYAQNTDGSTYIADGVKLNYNNTFSAGVDNLDVRKINNTYDNLSIKNGNVNLIVERRPHIVNADTIKLNISGMRLAPYRIEIDPSVLTNPNLEGTFVDNYTGIRTTLSFTDITAISFDITNDAASRAVDRFMIVFKEISSTSFNNIAAARTVGKTVKVNWITQNEVGVTNYTVEHSTDGVNFTAIAAQTPTANNGTNPSYSYVDATASAGKNWYRVKVNIGTTLARFTAIAMVNELPITTTNANATMGIYPNPVEDGRVNFKLYNQAAGNYSVVITTATGQVVQRAIIKVQTNAVAQTINIGAASAGLYYATIIDEKGMRNTIAFMVK
jgi:Secretion system C-terminal sorting domain